MARTDEELESVLIRLLDDCAIFGVDLEDELGVAGDGGYGTHESFGENANLLHDLITLASMAYEGEDPGWRQFFAHVYTALYQLCELYGIDLEAEYERKMAYNRTRAYKHGGRTI